jgi:hypothetical protein
MTSYPQCHSYRMPNRNIIYVYVDMSSAADSSPPPPQSVSSPVSAGLTVVPPTSSSSSSTAPVGPLSPSGASSPSVAMLAAEQAAVLQLREALNAAIDAGDAEAASRHAAALARMKSALRAAGAPIPSSNPVHLRVSFNPFFLQVLVISH